MSGTISGYQNTLQILSTLTPDVTIIGTIKAGSALPSSTTNLSKSFGAVYGPSGADFTVTNLGLVDDTSTAITNYANAGIVLGATGSVDNQGIILAAITGVYLNQGGSVTNSGSIIGNEQGIVVALPTLANGRNFVENTGFIDTPAPQFTIAGSTGTYGSSGIFAIGAGTVLNAAAGIIDAKYGLGIGLFAENTDFLAGTSDLAAGSVGNAGTIDAAYGISFDALGTLTNAGQIDATKIGVNILAGTVANSGSITGGEAGIIAYGYSSVLNSGSIVNTGTGTFVTADPEFPVQTLHAVGVALLDGGLISNASTGIIDASAGTGIDLSIGGTLENAGSIIGDYYGVRVESYTTAANGPATIANSGLIEATARHFVHNGTTVGGAGIVLSAGGTIVNDAGGTIIGYNAVGGFGASVSIDNLGLISGEGSYSAIYLTGGGAVTNSGTVTTQALVNNLPNPVAGIFLQPSGSATNTSTGLITGGGGVYFKNNGYFENNGRIEAEATGFDAIGLATVNNTGFISVTAEAFSYKGQTYISAGIDLGGGGEITNSGTVIASAAGIFTYGTVSILNSGLIEANGTAPAAQNATLGGTFTIEPTGIEMLGAANVTNAATGVIISSAGYGVELQVGGSLNNAGGISGLGAGLLALGEAFVTNSGSIAASGATFVAQGQTGGASAVTFLDGGDIANLAGGSIIGLDGGVGAASMLGVATTVTNNGLIEATGRSVATAGSIIFAPIGVALLSGGSVINASTGTIIGDGNGVVIETTLAPAIVTNSGLIEAVGTTFTLGTSDDASTGVFLANGGLLTNQAGGTISGYGGGVLSFIDLGPAEATRNGTIATTVVNDGLIEGSSSTIDYVNGSVVSSSGGVVLNAGGTLVNQASGTIIGHFGVFIDGGSSIISNGADNLGTITGVTSDGIILGENANLDNSGVIGSALYGAFLYAANQLTNTGTISGTNAGIFAFNSFGGASTIFNSGEIIGADATHVANGSVIFDWGAELITGGTFTNEAGGLVTGYTGFVGGAGTTLINAGTITAEGTLTGTNVGLAVDFIGAGATLVEDPGSVIDGIIVDTLGSAILELAAGSQAGGISINPGLIGFDRIEVDTGATWDITGASSLTAAEALVNNGTISETASDSLVIAGAVSGTGVIRLDPTTIVLDGSVAAGQQVSFAGSGDVLVLGDPTGFAGTIEGFGIGDDILFPSLTSFTSENFANGVLTIVEPAGTIALTFANSPVIPEVSIVNGVLEVTCFVAGTRIATPAGEVAVETLQICDFVHTQAGVKRVKWIGRRSYEGRFIRGNRKALPICIEAHAIADNVPARDLWVSPGHAISIDGVLIHASRLVNGVSVIQAAAVDQVTYFHVELEDHAIIFAENCPAETFMDEHFRQQFQNAADFRRRYPGVSAPRTACQPQLKEGFLLQAIQRRIDARAGIVAPATTTGPLRGFIDQAGDGLCRGWAQDMAAPEAAVCLNILHDGMLLGRVLANMYRADLEAAGLGSGNHGFTIALPPGISGISLRRSADQAALSGAENHQSQAA